MGNLVKVARLADLEEQGAKAVYVMGKSIVICRSDKRVFALENECSHAFEPLECGLVRAGWIACPAHGTRFDLETGEPLNPPATKPVKTYGVELRDGWVCIDPSGIA